MREVVLYMSVSVNGLVASDREHPGVAIAVADVKQWKLEQISSAGAHLMGHTTYAEKSGYWPGSDDAYATPMNDIPKIVFSTTLDDDEATWRVTRVARGDLAAEIADIKTEPFVVVWGGAPRRRCAGRARPDRRVPPARPTDADEYRLLVQPMVLGSGRALFDTVPSARHLDLVASAPIRSGIVLQIYRP